jgi:hypothetical protein
VAPNIPTQGAVPRAVKNTTIIRPWFNRQTKPKVVHRVELTELCACFVQRFDELRELGRPTHCQEAGARVKMDVVEFGHINLEAITKLGHLDGHTMASSSGKKRDAMGMSNFYL